MNENDGFLTPERAAVRAKRSVVTIYRWMRSGRLKTYAVDAGRRTGIKPEDLEKLLKPVLRRVK